MLVMVVALVNRTATGSPPITIINLKASDSCDSVAGDLKRSFLLSRL